MGERAHEFDRVVARRSGHGHVVPADLGHCLERRLHNSVRCVGRDRHARLQRVHVRAGGRRDDARRAGGRVDIVRQRRRGAQPLGPGGGAAVDAIAQRSVDLPPRDLGGAVVAHRGEHLTRR